MANSYTQVYVQFVFAVKYRAAVIDPVWEIDLHKYITKIVQENKHQLIAINSMPDHIHMLVRLYKNQTMPDLMRLVKAN